MKSIKSKLIPIRDMLEAILPGDVHHYFRRVKKNRYIIWAEDGETNPFNGEDEKAEQQITGTIDLFTQTEYDPAADQIQEGLNQIGATWDLLNVGYEEETKLIHWEWEFRAL